jgi:hypothetical protein
MLTPIVLIPYHFQPENTISGSSVISHQSSESPE